MSLKNIELVWSITNTFSKRSSSNARSRSLPSPGYGLAQGFARFVDAVPVLQHSWPARWPTRDSGPASASASGVPQRRPSWLTATARLKRNDWAGFRREQCS